jgi:hypothetical protein
MTRYRAWRASRGDGDHDDDHLPTRTRPQEETR